jgi:hypothetical protein
MAAAAAQQVLDFVDLLVSVVTEQWQLQQQWQQQWQLSLLPQEVWQAVHRLSLCQ